MPNTDFMVHELYDHAFRNASYTPPATVYVALLTTLPSNSTGSGLVECSAAWYSRQSVTFGAAANRGVTNSAQITFTSNASEAVLDDIEGVGIYDASTAGNLMRVVRATANLIVQVGGQVIIPTGQLALTETWNL